MSDFAVTISEATQYFGIPIGKSFGRSPEPRLL